MSFNSCLRAVLFVVSFLLVPTQAQAAPTSAPLPQTNISVELCHQGTTPYGESIIAFATHNSLTDCNIFAPLMTGNEVNATSLTVTGGFLRRDVEVQFSTTQAFTIIFTRVVANDTIILFSGAPFVGSNLTIESCSFRHSSDNPRFAVLDFSNLTMIPNRSTFAITSNEIFLAVPSTLNAKIAAIGFAQLVLPLLSELKIIANTISFRNISVNAGTVLALFMPKILALGAVILFSKNIVQTDAQDLHCSNTVGAFIRLWLSPNDVNRTTVAITHNLLEGITTIVNFNVTGNARVDFSEEDNVASNAGPIDNFVYAFEAFILSRISVRRNTFGSYVDRNFLGGNPTLWFYFFNLKSGVEFRINDNRLHADAFITTPIRFPWTSNVGQAVTFELVENSFTQFDLVEPSIPMSSFKVDPGFFPAYQILSVLYFCYDHWPPTPVPEPGTNVSNSTIYPTASPLTADKLVSTVNKPVGAVVWTDSHCATYTPRTTATTTDPNAEPHDTVARNFSERFLELTTLAMVALISLLTQI